MPNANLPDKSALTIGFAHAAYRLGDEFTRRATGVRHFEVRTFDDLKARGGEIDVLVISGLWRNELLDHLPRLRYIQSVSAGVDQYARDRLQKQSIRLASAQGANERAVAEHAVALMLAQSRHIASARENQARRHWRPMISDLALREDELGGKTLLIVGLGRIGQRLAHLAKAFDMRVIGLRRDPAAGGGAADAVHPTAKLLALLPEADIVALTCPLNAETENIIDARALAAMKPSAVLVNVARGRCVDEEALIAALKSGRLASAALDCVREEPLPAASPLWAMENVLITPHTGGETRRYEARVVDLLIENLGRLWRGETALKNQIV